MVSLAEVSIGRWYEITNVNLNTAYWAFNIWDGGVVVGSNYSYGNGHAYNSPFDMPLFTKSTTISSLTGIPLLTAPTPTTATIYIDSTGGGQILIDGVTAPSQVVRSIGNAITFTARPISGYAFQKWQVYVNNALYKEYTNNPVTLTVDRNYSVTGVFIQDQNALCCPDGWTIDSTGMCYSQSGEGAEPPHYCSLGGIPVSQAPPTSQCIPSWVCEKPLGVLTGYEVDGCGNRRLNSVCNPSPSLIITYLTVTDSTDGRVFIDFGVAGSGIVTVKIDDVVKWQGTLTNITELFTFPVSIGTHTINVNGTVKQVTIAGAIKPPIIQPPIVDKYYDCVGGKCIEKVGGQYKNDPKCGGKCAPPGNNTGTYLLLGAIILGVMVFIKGRK